MRGVVAEGGQVVIADLQPERGESLASDLGNNARFIQTDVTSEQDIIDAIALAEAEFGHLDGMVNNAGIVGATGSILEIEADDYDHTMSILSRAVFLGVKHAARAMKPHGKGAILFALSDDARYMTGHTLVIDAGQTTSHLLTDFHASEAEMLLHAGKKGEP